MKKGFRHILVPVDFTPKNRPALEIALRLAVQFRARVMLWHVVEPVEGRSRDVLAFHASLRNRAERRFAVLTRPFRRRGVSVKSGVVLGHRAPTIVKQAIRDRVDLIVMSSHPLNLSRPSHDWASISYKVAVLSQCPVLLVK